MSRPQPSDARALDGGDASATSQQELYGRREPDDLDDGRRPGDEDIGDAQDAKAGRDVDATGRPSTARANANTQ
jgi:hypothetical protein